MPDWAWYILGAVVFLIACRAFIRFGGWLGDHGFWGDGGMGSI